MAEIKGVIIRELKRNTDARGSLAECFRSDELPKGLKIAMAYISETRPGVSRGPHEHLFQTDYFVFSSSMFRLHLWDNRDRDKNGRRTEMIFNVGEDNPAIVIVPPKVIHGYRNIGHWNGSVLNFPDRLYRGSGKKEPVDEVRYEGDKRFRI